MISALYDKIPKQVAYWLIDSSRNSENTITSQSNTNQLIENIRKRNQCLGSTL